MWRFVYAYPDVPHPLQLAGAQTIATAPDSAQSWLPASPYIVPPLHDLSALDGHDRDEPVVV